jgi:nitrite reductase/ring-hydroxylating ferredoxin subunit/uncharacterized membrane protein
MSVSASGMTEAVDRLENAGSLDPVVTAVRRVVRATLRRQSVRDALHGVWLGHPLHPTLTDVPIGSWTAAAVLDAVPGMAPASATLIATGCLGYVPTALAGWADWSELDDEQQRVGLVHAAAGAVAFSCYVASLAARTRGNTVRGKVWAYTGFALVSAAGYLGGHLAYRQAAGVNHAAGKTAAFPEGWHSIGPLYELPDAELVQRSVEGLELVVVRRGSHVDVLADSCSHLAAPLSEGTFIAADGQGCVVCPWHGSTFRLADGGVVHGPSTSPMPRFDTRVVDGDVEVRLPGDG